MVDGSDRDLIVNPGESSQDFSATDSMIVVMEAGGSPVIDLGDAEWVLKANFDRQAFDLLIEGGDGEQVLIRDYFAQGEPAALQLGPEGALQGHVVASLAGPWLKVSTLRMARPTARQLVLSMMLPEGHGRRA